MTTPLSAVGSSGAPTTRAGAVNLVGGALGSLSSLVLAVVLARWLGDVGTGSFFTFVAALTIAANLLELGADTGLLRTLAAQRALGTTADSPRSVAWALGPVLGVGTVVCLGAVALDPHVSWVPPAELLVLACATSMTAVLLAGTRGLGAVWPNALLWNVGLPGLRLCLVVLTLAWGASASDAVRAWAWAGFPVSLAAAVCLAVLLRRAVGRRVAVNRTGTRELGRSFWRFSSPRGVSAGVEILLSWSDVLLVGLIVGAGPAGVYAVVTRCVTAGMLVDTAVRVTVGPHLGAHLARGDLGSAARVQEAAVHGAAALAVPAYGLLALLAPDVLSVFGADFTSGAASLRLLAAAMVLQVLSGPLQTVLLMSGASATQLGVKSVALAVLVVLNLVLDPVWGILGAAVAWTCAIVADVVLTWWAVARGGVRVRARRLLPLLVLGAASAVAGFAIASTTTSAGVPRLVVAALVTACLHGPPALVLLRRGGSSAG